MKKKLIRPSELKQLKQWWIVFYSTGNVAHWSLSGTRKGAIEAFIDDSNYNWPTDSKKNGWFVGKVYVDFLLCK